MTRDKLKDRSISLPQYKYALCFDSSLEADHIIVAKTVLLSDSWDEIEAALLNFMKNKLHEIINILDGMWILRSNLMVINLHNGNLEWSLKPQEGG